MQRKYYVSNGRLLVSISPFFGRVPIQSPYIPGPSSTQPFFLTFTQKTILHLIFAINQLLIHFLAKVFSKSGGGH